MRAEWQVLRAKLVDVSATLAFQKDFERICGRHEVLRSFLDPADLFDRLHCCGDDHLARDLILRALVKEAQEQSRPSLTCVILILLALWPGLDAIYRSLSRHFREDPGQLVSEISARATQGILTLDPQRVNWIAATLIQNTERDIRRALRAIWARDGVTDEYDEDNDPQPAGISSLLGLPPSLDADTETRLITDWLRDVIGDDAALVVAVAINGEHQHEAARRLGLAPEAARKRYQRAIARLRLMIPKEF